MFLLEEFSMDIFKADSAEIDRAMLRVTSTRLRSRLEIEAGNRSDLGFAIHTLGAAATFLLAVSFLLSTPGAAVHLKYGFPVLGDAGQFLIKIWCFWGASLWTAAEAYGAV
jgi:hypothetical protein